MEGGLEPGAVTVIDLVKDVWIESEIPDTALLFNEATEAFGGCEDL